ncbi:hypothetical protein ASswx1_405 [Aeromonas phage Asswx_1]|uniref:Uncharacterized protein n=2 Tax=Caudoviricetes TaxID=2731619 RepID=A0A411B8V4_9CAUD|nr:hypothetical protein ASswx1_405 [Aeromonas phage Asswx_1]
MEMKSSEIHKKITEKREALIQNALNFVYEYLLKKTNDYNVTVSIPNEIIPSEIRSELVERMVKDGYGVSWSKSNDMYSSYSRLVVVINE